MTHAPPLDLTVARATSRVVAICETDTPLCAALGFGRAALAVICGVDGPSYRPLGAMMVVDENGRAHGNLSSGCIERDVILHARQALADGRVRQLRYGAGSPFRDLALPCGGGLDILVLPDPDRDTLAQAAAMLDRRQGAMLLLGPLMLHIQPRLRFAVLGAGPEAHCFAVLAAAAGYPVETFSPDPATLRGLENGHALDRPRWPERLRPDPRTAVTLFFHDHDWEPPLLQAALSSPALYVGAQGSLRAHQARCDALSALGLSGDRIARLASPFGLVPSARDPRTLAASVLAQVLDRARLA